jgi:hypothetical protein
MNEKCVGNIGLTAKKDTPTPIKYELKPLMVLAAATSGLRDKISLCFS